MPGHSVPLAALGGGILIVCFLAFNGGSQVANNLFKNIQIYGDTIQSTTKTMHFFNVNGLTNFRIHLRLK